MFFGELFSFFFANSSLVSKITFVPNQHNTHVRICMLPSILQPASQVVKCLSPRRKEEHFMSFESRRIPNE